MTKYFKYQEPEMMRLEPKRFDEFEKEFFDMEKQNQRQIFDDEDLNWSELMDKRIIAGFITCRDLA